MTSPAEGANVSGVVAVSANADDDVGVSGVAVQVGWIQSRRRRSHAAIRAVAEHSPLREWSTPACGGRPRYWREPYRFNCDFVYDVECQSERSGRRRAVVTDVHVAQRRAPFCLAANWEGPDVGGPYRWERSPVVESGYQHIPDHTLYEREPFLRRSHVPGRRQASRRRRARWFVLGHYGHDDLRPMDRELDPNEPT